VLRLGDGSVYLAYSHARHHSQSASGVGYNVVCT
jgi:hypothetical protein